MQESSTQFISISECARLLDIPYTSLYKHVTAKSAKYTTTRVGSTIGVIPSEFEKYMHDRSRRLEGVK